MTLIFAKTHEAADLYALQHGLDPWKHVRSLNDVRGMRDYDVAIVPDGPLSAAQQDALEHCRADKVTR